jgi:putative aldouronate transport system permease protein
MPTIIITLILRLGSLLGVGFEKNFLMQTDLNLRVSEVISTYVYKRGLGSGGNSDYAFSTAVGLFNNVINLVLLVSVNKIASKVSETSLW